jgi:hypothetical protein
MDCNQLTQTMRTLLEFFFKHQLELKLYHFQTTRYGAHKASDAYIDTFGSKFDQFMEVLQGYCDRGVANVGALSVVTTQVVSDQTIQKILSEYIDQLNKYATTLKECEDLTTILFDMIGNARQLKYLLQFQ